jgi:hypothetical protein
MTTQEIGGKTHLFIEAGGFGPKNPPGWKPSLPRLPNPLIR